MAITAALVAVFVAGLAALWYYTNSASPADGPATAGAPAASATGALEPEFEEWSRAPDGPPASLEGSLEEARSIATANPENGQAMANVGHLQLQLGRATDAMASFQAAAERDPQNWRYRFDVAQAQCSLTRWDECISALRDAARLAPDNWTIAHNLGVALHRRGVDDVAVAEYSEGEGVVAGERARASRSCRQLRQTGSRGGGGRGLSGVPAPGAVDSACRPHPRPGVGTRDPRLSRRPRHVSAVKSARSAV